MKDCDKIILDLCGGSGAWSKPYQDANYDVQLVDLNPYGIELSAIGQGRDVRLFPKLDSPVYGVLASPPCTKFAVSGNRWKKTPEDYIGALSVVDACLRIILISNPVFWVLENPVGTLHKWLGKPRMYFTPSDYGDPYSKKTCLWGNFNPPGKWFPTKPVIPPKGSHSMDIHYNITSQKNRSAIRSITPPGFVKAFFEANK